MAQRYPSGGSEGMSGATGPILPGQFTGYKLYSSDNKSIGKISDEGPNYVHVMTGLLGLGPDLFVPRSAIGRCADDHCYLNMTADQVHTMGWDHAPTEQPAATYREEATAMPISRGAVSEEVQRIPLRDEEIEVRKHREKVGEVVITKEVVEEQRTIDVPVSREEVTIERHMVDRPTEEALPPVGREAETVRVPIYEEFVDVEKHARVREEIVVSPEDVTTQERVTRTVRREVPKVETSGEAEKFVHEEANVEELPAEKSSEQRRKA
jgi:uncharacterized protein (TIGR02271 family)